MNFSHIYIIARIIQYPSALLFTLQAQPAREIVRALNLISKRHSEILTAEFILKNTSGNLCDFKTHTNASRAPVQQLSRTNGSVEDNLIRAMNNSGSKKKHQ